MFLIWAASISKPNNFFQIDDHIIYILVLIGLLFAEAGQYAGLGRIWTKTKLVQKVPGLKFNSSILY